MKRIAKFGPQFGKPKGPRMPSMKARASRVPGGRVKFAEGGDVPPKFKPDPETQAAMAAERARQAERDRKTQAGMTAAEKASEARAAAKAKQEAAEAKSRKAMEEAYEAAPKRNMKAGGSVGSASKRADGCAMKGKTKGRFV
jgi:hypothetical protein